MCTYMYEYIVVRKHDEYIFMNMLLWESMMKICLYIVDENVLWYIVNIGTCEVQATWCGIIYMYCCEKGELWFDEEMKGVTPVS